jgi:hypothetical protein
MSDHSAGSSVHTVRDTWHVGARGLAWGCVERLKPRTWLQLAEGDPEFQLLTQIPCCSDIFICSLSSVLPILLNGAIQQPLISNGSENNGRY